MPAPRLALGLGLFAAAAATSPFVTTAHGIGVAVRTAAGAWVQPLPLEVQTVYRNGSTVWTRAAYSAAAPLFRGAYAANGTVVTPGGAVVFVADAYSNSSDAGFTVAREVTVVSAGAADEFAFSTRFSLPAPDALAAAARLLFLPGVAYQNASALPRGALAGDPLAAHILVREDRLPLPLALVYFPDAGGGASGAAVLAHARPDGATIPNEDFTARIVDAGLQFGSIGFLNARDGGGPTPRVSVAFEFPGTEGDRTYVYKPSDGWANRSHPLAPGVPHAYELAFAWRDGAGSYAQAATRAWRDAFAAAAPRAPAAPPPAQLYRDGMDVLAAYGVRYNGVPSMPFEAALPGGAVVDTSSQMGFVGRALPCAALLLFDAVVAAPNATRAAQAEAIVDVWAAEALTPCGVARTWFDITPGSGIAWRASDAYQGSVRIMSDGMLGMLDAWALAPAKAAWLAAAVRYADFLVSVQAADGSVRASWDWGCAPLAGDTRQTPHVVPFLAAAFAATADARYYTAAVAAGGYAAALFADGFSYEGGAVDNPDVPDREAGWLAAQAFIALFELTGDAAWLAPAGQAAAYAETFVYMWDVPIACAQSPPPVYPCRRTTLGASLIATGQSGADNYMAIAHHDFRRLGAWLGDDHFTAVADLLAAATTQVTDWDGSLGYARRGLMTEAATLSVRRGAGVADWLPWLTANVLHPLEQAMRAACRADGRAHPCGLAGLQLASPPDRASGLSAGR